MTESCGAHQRGEIVANVAGNIQPAVPRGYDVGKIPGILERKKSWIRAAIERARAQRKFFEAEPSWKPPVQIKLPAVGLTWHVTAKETDVPWAAVRQLGHDRLLIFGATENQAACRAALSPWLMRQTREYLVPRLKALSLRTSLKYHRTFVKRPADPLGQLLSASIDLPQRKTLVSAPGSG